MNLPNLPLLSMEETINFSSDVSWGVSDPVRFKQLMDEAKSLVSPGYYLGDNLFTWCRNNSLFEDPAFLAAWENNITSDADHAVAWRRYILATSAYHAVQIDGDFVECGTHAGTGIKTVMDYLGGTDFPRTFWGYDTFDYHPIDGHQMQGQSDGFFEIIKQRFSHYPQVKLIKGFVPDSFSQGIPEKIAYLHIDMNNAEAEIAALDVLFDRVVTSGVIIFDDYEWFFYREQKREEDQWFEKRGYRVIPLPTGQGILFKR
jgi:O-methyltransferase